MKKIITVLTTLLMVVIMAGCSNKTEATVETTDSEYVKNKGVLVVGITDFAPMDYKDANGNWIGFDADLATKFAEELGVKVEFVEINWDNKVLDLNDKAIDCVWNGMTLTDAVKNQMETSKAYILNAQTAVVKKDVAANINSIDDLKELSVAVEVGSAGKASAESNGLDFVELDTQAKALLEVNAGTSDAAIIDLTMAKAMTGEGTDYTNLTYTVLLDEEEYGVGFRKGSDLAEMLNAFLANNTAVVEEIALTYGLENALVD